MLVQFFYSLEDKTKLDRNMNFICEKECKLKEPTDVLNPTISVSKFNNWQMVNAIYIEELKRFYFVNESPMLLGGVVSFACHVDVLKTYADALKGTTALIDRNEFLYNPYIEDPQLRVKANRLRQVRKIGNVGNPSGAYFALTVTGGGAI